MQVLQVQEYNSYAINKYGYNPIHLFLNYRNNELRRAGYNDEQLAKYLDTELSVVKALLISYARKELGEKILKCVEETGECNFEAEL